MTIDRGRQIDVSQIKERVYVKNLKRLMIWMSVGADVENGLWAIYGSRLGLIKANLDPEFDVNNIRDYEWFKEYFEDLRDNQDLNEITLETGIQTLGYKIKTATGLVPALLSADQSKFFKYVYEAPRRSEVLRTEVEVDTQGF
jgi:hypothetical protein